MNGDQTQLAWEERWSLSVALMTFAAIGLLIASAFITNSLGSGEGEAASLLDVYEHGSSVTLSTILQGIAFALLAGPLVYLFKAAAARSTRMQRQFLPLVVAAPLALGVAAVVGGVGANDAASDFVSGKATTSLTKKEAAADCRSERKDDATAFRDEFGAGADALSACTSRQLADDRAENAIADSTMKQISSGFQLGGVLALAFALVYTCLHAMRVGLLTRFWGSLGMALGVGSVFGLILFALFWFLYLGLLIAGRVLGGRPPAWAAGEAIPWPTPGEKAAEELSQAEDDPPPSAADLETPPDKGQSS
jgi:hypothetical protein